MESTGLRSRQRRRRIARCWRDIAAAGRVEALVDPVTWAEAHVDLSRDHTAAAQGLIRIRDKTPYMVRPVSYAMGKGQRKLTVQAIEQTGKSTVWKLILMWILRFRPVAAGLIYQNKPVGTVIIRDSLVKLMEGVVEFRRGLRRYGWSLERLDLGAGLVYLMTGDGEIISYPLGLVIGDEINKWRREKAARRSKGRNQVTDAEYQVSRIKDMDKRSRTYADSLRVLVCSPEGSTAPISTEYEQSSQGRYYCRCRGCGELTMDSTKPEEYLRYTPANGVVVPESVRLVCPACGYAHDENCVGAADRQDDGGAAPKAPAGESRLPEPLLVTDKEWVTRHGDYIDEFPDRRAAHEGDCWGALASQFPGVGWQWICEWLEREKADNSREVQAYVANSIRGLPYKPEIMSGAKLSVLREFHRWPEGEPIPVDNFEAVYLSVDTQDVGYWLTVMAVDAASNWYLLYYAMAWEDDDVLRAWNGEVAGVRPMAAIIDEGGHRKDDVNALVKKLGKGVYKYKGESYGKSNFRRSDNPKEPLLILAKAREYQAELLYMLYSLRKDQEGKIRTDNHYFWIACEIKKTLLFQLGAVQPPMNNPDAEYQDWTHNDRQHDLFDAVKMALVLHDFAREHFTGSFWRRGQADYCRRDKQVTRAPRQPRRGIEPRLY